MYQELVQKNGKFCLFSCLKGRIYLRGVTLLSKSWLPRLSANSQQCVFSPPLETPQPFYDSKKDCIMCYVTPRYGPHLWELAAYAIEYPRSESNVYNWFAKELLEGKVIKELEVLKTVYSSSPSLLTKAQMPIRAMTLVAALRKENVMTKKQLMQVWKKNPFFLKTELCAWIPPRYQEVLSSMWSYVIAGRDVPEERMKSLLASVILVVFLKKGVVLAFVVRNCNCSCLRREG